MGLGSQAGLVREGYLADLLLVRGNPLKDVAVLQDRANLAMIMKDGAIYKDPRRGQFSREGLIAAE
jgi:imidazolonepropionase-like amidohydrolase